MITHEDLLLKYSFKSKILYFPIRTKKNYENKNCNLKGQ